ncbi:hypothetical protein [uncultured Tenacibaculum sp.]|uniref:hypothetical protein n=1 Tax=uncultured Tenacibaculum sp. TaxID=174713 RepID=UPI00262EE41E|nr:hypothetical protein [uncultured Tenacibaculum sp.]
MDLDERLEFCKICKNRKIDFKIGLTCSLTNEKPTFIDSCSEFIKDAAEADRILKMRLDSAGNSRSQNGSLNPDKNINYGMFLVISGLLIFLFISALFGAIIVFGGISFYIRGEQQKRILIKNNKLNKKIDQIKK